MNKTKVLIISYILMALALTGCASEIPEMSEKQTAMVTEYAAGSVLNQMPQSTSRLVDTSQEYDPSKMTKYEKSKLGIKEPEPAPAPAPIEESKPEKDDSVSGNSSSGKTESKEPEMPPLSAADVMEVQDISVTMNGFAVADSYPEAAEGTDLIFAMNAPAGNKLLIAKLSVTNTGSEQRQVNTITRNDLHYKMVINGENTQNTLVTLLTDDFSAMNETLEPGQTFDAVLIAQVSDELAASVGSVSVEIRSDVGRAVIGE